MSSYERGEIIYYWAYPGKIESPIWVGVCTTDTDANGQTTVWWVRNDQHRLHADETLNRINVDRIGKVLNMDGENPKLIMWNGYGYA